jgi:hypothetical protein
MIFTDWVKTAGTASNARVTDRISGSRKSVEGHGSRFPLPPSAREGEAGIRHTPELARGDKVPEFVKDGGCLAERPPSPSHSRGNGGRGPPPIAGASARA